VPLGDVAEIERLAEGGLQAVGRDQMRIGKSISDRWLLRARGIGARCGTRWVVGVGLERGDGDVHQLVVAERKTAKQTVEVGSAVGAVQAKDLGLAGGDGRLPDADQMALGHQFGCGGYLGAFAMLDLGVRVPSGTLTWNSTRYSMMFSQPTRLHLDIVERDLLPVDVHTAYDRHQRPPQAP
jgi:hypothetical protein